MENIKKYYKCHKCELNYVENEGELCEVCKKNLPWTHPARPEFFDNGEYRRTVCYSCHTPLDSRCDEICPKCHWIICPTCGACGCK